ncbi:MAG TPA: hypothetical protein VFP54_11395 [Acidimicrobiales bacterium]|nr:hypothetical protein [Acidimicrobiales bacterium]
MASRLGLPVAVFAAWYLTLAFGSSVIPPWGQALITLAALVVGFFLPWAWRRSVTR